VPGGARRRRRSLGGVQRPDGDVAHELEVLA
jgi:hypothetical protein